MPAKKRFASSKRVAKLRDRVLLLSLNGDLEGARSALQEVLSLRDKGLISDENMKEFNCRALESEIDIAAIEAKPIHSLANVLRTIAASDDFSEKRRVEMLDYGLTIISKLTR